MPRKTDGATVKEETKKGYRRARTAAKKDTAGQFKPAGRGQKVVRKSGGTPPGVSGIEKRENEQALKDMKRKTMRIGNQVYEVGEARVIGKKEGAALRAADLSEIQAEQVKRLYETEGPAAAREYEEFIKARQEGKSVDEARAIAKAAAKGESTTPPAKKTTAKKTTAKKTTTKPAAPSKPAVEPEAKATVKPKATTKPKVTGKVVEKMTAAEFSDEIAKIEKQMSVNAKAVRAGTMTLEEKKKANDALARRKDFLQKSAKKRNVELNNKATRPARNPKPAAKKAAVNKPAGKPESPVVPKAEKPKVAKKAAAKPAAKKVAPAKTTKPARKAAVTSPKPTEPVKARPPRKPALVKNVNEPSVPAKVLKTAGKYGKFLKGAGRILGPAGTALGMYEAGVKASTAKGQKSYMDFRDKMYDIQANDPGRSAREREAYMKRNKGVHPLVPASAKKKGDGNKKTNNLAGARYAAMAKMYPPAPKPSSPKPAGPKAPKPNTPSGSTAPKSGGKGYRVKSGDTLYAIAKKYGTTVDTLYKLNPEIKRRRDAGKVTIFSNSLVRLPKK